MSYVSEEIHARHILLHCFHYFSLSSSLCYIIR